MTVEDAYQFFDSVPTIKRKLKTLIDVGLSYIKVGQNATTLSGGEAQRVKLAKRIQKKILEKQYIFSMSQLLVFIYMMLTSY